MQPHIVVLATAPISCVNTGAVLAHIQTATATTWTTLPSYCVAVSSGLFVLLCLSCSGVQVSRVWDVLQGAAPILYSADVDGHSAIVSDQIEARRERRVVVVLCYCKQGTIEGFHEWADGPV